MEVTRNRARTAIDGAKTPGSKGYRGFLLAAVVEALVALAVASFILPSYRLFLELAVPGQQPLSQPPEAEIGQETERADDHDAREDQRNAESLLGRITVRITSHGDAPSEREARTKIGSMPRTPA